MQLSLVGAINDERIEELEKLIAPYHYNIPVAKIRLTYGVFDIINKLYEVKELEGVNVVAAVAIASPDSFFDMLTSFGANIVHKQVYPDHYYFTKGYIIKNCRRTLSNYCN